MPGLRVTLPLAAVLTASALAAGGCSSDPAPTATPAPTSTTDGGSCAAPTVAITVKRTGRELGYLGGTAVAGGVTLDRTTATLVADTQPRVVATSGTVDPTDTQRVLSAAGDVGLPQEVVNEAGLTGEGRRNQQWLTYAAVRTVRGTWSLPGCEADGTLPSAGRVVAVTRIERARVLKCYVPVRTDRIGREALDGVCGRQP